MLSDSSEGVELDRPLRLAGKGGEGESAEGTLDGVEVYAEEVTTHPVEEVLLLGDGERADRVISLAEAR